MKRGKFWPHRRTHVALVATHLAALHEESAAAARELARVAETEQADDGTNDFAYRQQVIDEVNHYALALKALLPMPTKAAGEKEVSP